MGRCDITSIGEISPAIKHSPFSPFFIPLMTSLTPRRTNFALAAFLTNLYNFLVDFFDANGRAITEQAATRCSYDLEVLGPASVSDIASVGFANLQPVMFSTAAGADQRQRRQADNGRLVARLRRQVWVYIMLTQKFLLRFILFYLRLRAFGCARGPASRRPLGPGLKK